MRIFVGFVLLALAAVLLFFEVIALIDPVGTKMADDNDPFGPPPPWYVHVVWFGVIAAVGALGAKFLWGKASREASKRHVGDQ